MLTNNDSITYVPGLTEILKFESPLVRSWRRLLSAITEIDNIQNHQTQLLQLLNSRQAGSGEEQEALWCTLLHCQPDHGGIRVAQVIDSTAARQQALNSLQQHFGENKPTFFERDGQLLLDVDMELSNTWPSILSIMNQNLLEFVTNDRSAVKWHAFLNEVQMLVAQNTSLSELGVNSIWIEPIPPWLWLNEQSIDDQAFVDTDGVRLFLAADSDDMEHWLDRALKDMISKFKCNRHHVLTDGKRFWTCSLLQQMKLKWFG